MTVLGWGRSGVRSHRLGLPSVSLAVGGLGTVAFWFMVQGLTRLFTGHDDYAARAGQPARLVSRGRPVVHSGHPGGRRSVGWTPGLPVRPGGAGPLRPGGDAGGGAQWRTDPAAGGGGQGPRQCPVHRRRWIGRPRRPDRADLLGHGVVVGSALRLDERRIRLLVACGPPAASRRRSTPRLAGVSFAMELILHRASESFGMW